ncbi:hypothetical protein C8Q73DRAFT_747362 [Cubamyces lactineus]|nr:hypothetical protein C8Q73DRAFT_747362 [Cubamyces lactineus]
MLDRLPYALKLAVSRFLDAKDIVRLCSTCRALYNLMSDRSLWHHALSRLLVVFPQPRLSRNLNDLDAGQLKAQVLHSARLDARWHRPNYQPRRVQNFHCDSTVKHATLVTGGRWLVIVLYDGSLQLLELGASSPAATVSHPLTDDESVFYLSSRQSFTDDHEDLIILQMGVRYNQCNIYVYVAVIDPSPTLLLVGNISVTGSVWCCMSSSRYLVYGLDTGEGVMVLHVCTIGADNPEIQRPRVSMNIGPSSADEHLSISVLSEHQFICRCDTGAGIYRISPYSWSPHGHPVVIVGTRALHILRVGQPDGADAAAGAAAVDYRQIPYPLAPGAEFGYMGLGADSTEAHNGVPRVHFRTTIPTSGAGSWA